MPQRHSPPDRMSTDVVSSLVWPERDRPLLNII